MRPILRSGAKTAGAIAVTIIILVVVLVLGLWVFLAQPTFRTNEPSRVTVDTGRLRDHVIALSVTFHPRDYRNVLNTEQVVSYIADQFERSGADVSLQDFTVDATQNGIGGMEPLRFHNVIGLFGQGSGNRLVIGAHYDSCGDTPGADDNASGIAGLIELAYLFGRQPVPREIELVAWATEEPPFFGTTHMGSFIHSRSLVSSGIKPAGVIVLEMIGYFDEKAASQHYPLPFMRLFYPSRGNFIAVVGNMQNRSLTRRVKSLMKGATGLEVRSLCGLKSLPGVDFSDHRNYWSIDIPAVMITDTAFFRNPNYHERSDTAETLDFVKMGQVVTALYEVARGM